MSRNRNYEILDKILGDSQVRTTFGYWADLPHGGRVWIGSQDDLDRFLTEVAAQGGAAGYTEHRNSDIERYLRS